MIKVTLTEVLEAIRTLDASELHQVEYAIQEQRAAADYGYSLEEWRAMQSLMESGSMKEIKPRRKESLVEYVPVSLQGKPLSETIVEERR